MAVPNDGAQPEPEQPDARPRSPARYYSPQQGTFFAHRITLEGTGEDALAQSLSTARVDMNPHQVDAALFALASPLSKGVLLADEVGLGKTIEASLVIAQTLGRAPPPHPADRARVAAQAVEPGALRQVLAPLRDRRAQELQRRAQEGHCQALRARRQHRHHVLRVRGAQSRRNSRAASGTWSSSTKRTACATSIGRTVRRAPSACVTPRARSSRFC